MTAMRPMPGRSSARNWANRLAAASFRSPRGLRFSAASATAAVNGNVVGLRRLSEQEYRNSIADIFGKDIAVQGMFEPQIRMGGLVAVSQGGAEGACDCSGWPKRSSQLGSAMVMPFVRVGDLARRSSRTSLEIESVLHNNNGGDLIDYGTRLP